MAVPVAVPEASPPAVAQAVVATRVFQVAALACQKSETGYAPYVTVLVGGVVTFKVNVAALTPTLGIRDKSNSMIARWFAPVTPETVIVFPTLLLFGVI
jgi:hypothetical protein